MPQTEPDALPEPLLALLTERLPAEAAPGSLTPSATFESLGMDSLALMELVVAAEERFGIVLPEEALDLAPSATLADAALAFADAR
ncbi:acyl carrier protein [Streptomyces orinoci]|uniref:Acyl carrier protein n=1 Tax=Streptomyces orinoci TaxID=67339 RepID=A0ABV3JZG3_STRON|nr:acyl carrier protein [Streptomyces orinoci]